jgi:mannose-6-phosphate isomerase-like protein (cupin superfamily)
MDRPRTGPGRHRTRRDRRPGHALAVLAPLSEEETIIELTIPSAVGVDARFAELHRSADLSIGHYLIPAGAVDPQSPHTEDEVYVVLAGRGVLAGPEASIPVRAGSIVFVGGGEEHRFVDVTEDLYVAVVFGPAEFTRRPE